MNGFFTALKFLLPAAVLAGGLLLAGGCARSAPAAGDAPDRQKAAAPIEFAGHVVRVELEGGFFGLVAEDGRRFLPVDLPPAFRQDGLAVQVRGRRLPAAIGYRMWAPRLEILDIQRR